jgi:hypothetical protein
MLSRHTKINVHKTWAFLSWSTFLKKKGAINHQKIKRACTCHHDEWPSSTLGATRCRAQTWTKPYQSAWCIHFPMFHSYYPSLLCAVCTQDPWPQNKCKQILWVQSLTDAQNLGELLSLHLCAEVAQHEHHSDNIAHQRCIVMSSPPATLPPIYYLTICHFQLSLERIRNKAHKFRKKLAKSRVPRCAK